MRRATITVPPELDAALEAFMSAQPARPSLTSVVEAALDAYLHAPQPRHSSRLVDVIQARARMTAIGFAHGATRVGLFGSVANATDTPESDVDLWVETRQGVTLFDLAAMRAELEHLLGCRVDLVTVGGMAPSERDALVASSLVL